MKTNFGIKVKSLREKYGITMEDVANGTGISRSTISRWEHGHSVPNSFRTIRLLADFFHVPLHYFHDEEDILQDSPLLRSLMERVERLEKLLQVDAHNGQDKS